MLCNADLENGVCRAPHSIVRQTFREVAQVEPTDALETATNQALSEFVKVKQQLGTIQAALEKAILEQQQAAEQSQEAQAAVLAIHAQCIGQQLQQLNTMFTGGAGWPLCVTKLKDVLHATTTLSEAHQLRGIVSTAGICVLPDVSIERLASLLQPHGKDTCRVWRGQWLAIRSLQQTIFDELLPQAIASISSSLDEDSAFETVTAVSTLESASEAEAVAVEHLVENIESASRRLLQQMQSVTGLSIQTVMQLTPKSRASLDDMLMQQREWIFNAEVGAGDLGSTAS